MKTGLSAALFCLLCASSTQAAVTKFVVESCAPYPQDAKFEILSGHYEGALDPASVHNRITEPRLSAGNGGRRQTDPHH